AQRGGKFCQHLGGFSRHGASFPQGMFRYWPRSSLRPCRASVSGSRNGLQSSDDRLCASVDWHIGRRRRPDRFPGRLPFVPDNRGEGPHMTSVLPESKLEALITRHRAVEGELSAGPDREAFVRLSRELSEL